MHQLVLLSSDVRRADFLLSFDDPDNPRNPPGTADRQADRLLALLN
ncbi:hypothetical protein IPZ68_01400 [Streptomyces arenae]|nr:hypothetical protein [Streptomyces arenae]